MYLDFGKQSALGAAEGRVLLHCQFLTQKGEQCNNIPWKQDILGLKLELGRLQQEWPAGHTSELRGTNQGLQHRLLSLLLNTPAETHILFPHLGNLAGLFLFPIYLFVKCMPYPSMVNQHSQCSLQKLTK